MQSIQTTQPGTSAASAERLDAVRRLTSASPAAAIDRLLPLLADRDPLVRSDAARALAEAAERLAKQARTSLVIWHRPGDQDQLQALLQQIERRVALAEPQEREALAETLGHMRDHRATDLLVDMLQDENAGVRTAAADGLARTRDPLTVPSLLEASADPDPWVRRAIVSALGPIETPEALVGLLMAVEDTEALVRTAAARSLAHYPKAQSREALERLCQDLDPSVRLTAARTLCQIGDAGSLDELDALCADDTVCSGIVIGDVAAASIAEIRRRERGPRATLRRLYHRSRRTYRAWHESHQPPLDPGSSPE